MKRKETTCNVAVALVAFPVECRVELGELLFSRVGKYSMLRGQEVQLEFPVNFV